MAETTRTDEARKQLVEQHNLQLLNDKVNSLLENEPYEHPLKDNLTFSFDRPKDLLTTDVFSRFFKPASLFKALKGHTNQVCFVAFSPDSKLLASASGDNTVRLWNIPSGEFKAELKGHENAVRSVAFSPDGKSIVTGSHDKTVRTWSVATKQQLKILKGHHKCVWSVAWSPNGDLLASGSSDKTVILWDAISGSLKKKLTSHTSDVFSVSFSQNGNKLVCTGHGEWHTTAIIWDVNSGSALIELAHSHSVWSVCFSPDDQFVVTGCSDGIVRIFNANTSYEEKRFEGHNNLVNSVAISFDGSIIVSGSSDNSVRLWDVVSTKQLQKLDGHTKTVRWVAFSRNCKFIASGSHDNTVLLWNAPSSLQTPTSLLKSACFAGDVDSAKFQLDQGAFVNNKNGSTAIYAASSKGSKQLVELLIERGADINLRENNGSSALHAASYQGHIEVVIYLLDCGLSINDKGNGGSTALHQAIIGNHASIAQLLLQRGTDINIPNDSKLSALQLVNQSKSAEIKAAFALATSLQNKNLKSIPASALNHTAQFTLRLGNNKFGPDVWDTLTSSSVCAQFLVGLFLQSNPSLSTIPDSVAKLGQLLCLSVADCGLSASSIRALGLLPNLRSLDVSCNQLGDLPAEFSQLKELRILRVNKCNLSLVPAVIMQLLQLRDLDISNNPIHGLPFDLSHLPELTNLNLTDCPLTTIPREYHDSPTLRLLQFLRDSQESEAVYRSKLLLVGYGEVGKTTLLTTLFPLQSNLLEQAFGCFWTASCQIQGQQIQFSIQWDRDDEFDETTRDYYFERGENSRFNEETNDAEYIDNDLWNLQQPISLSNAIIKTNPINETGWSLQPANSNVVYQFQCKDALGRDEWVRTCKFVALNSRTDGISVIQRQIKYEELDAAVKIQAPTAPYVDSHVHQTKAPFHLQLTAWDFAGQYEYQDGHQLFLMSRAIYLVLWDVTLSKRKPELAKLRHWLITLQLHLGTTHNNMRSSVLVYIVGTHIDSDGAFLLEPCLEQVKQVLMECNFTLPYCIVDPIDARNQDYVNKLKNQLLADMAVQSHLGELVPKGYLQIEQYLLEEQRKYRLNMLRGGNDVIVPIIQRKVLSERWHRDISYVTRALELLNLWGSIVYFGRDSNKHRHVFLDELVVYAPEWLTISVLGSIVQLMRQQKDKLKKNNSSSGYEPIVLHSELIKLSSVWQNIPSHLHEHVMEMLYSLDLGFSVSPASDQSKPFAERSSFFPQLLPFLPPQLLTWQLTSATTEAVYIIKLNGFAMGFHGVLFSRLQSLLKSVEYASCWQCGFLFSDVSQSILVTIHDDTQQIRICIRNSSNPSKSFNDIRLVTTSLIDERYRGVRIIGEFIECACKDCKNVKWRWNSKIYKKVCNDTNIKSLCNDTTSRADLAIAMGRYNQPDGSPHLFNIEDIMNIPSSQEHLICKKSNNSVLVSSLKHLIELSKPSPFASTSFPVRVALVVGNDAYIEKPLNHAVSDAAAVRNRLRELGFNTIHVFDGTKQQIDEAIQAFEDVVYELAQAAENEEGVLSVIYFSGHAYQENGANLFVASDNQSINLKDVFDQLEMISNTFSQLSFPVCIILDACRIGESTLFYDLEANLDYLFVYACRSGQESSDGRLHEGHGPFATAVLRHLQRGRSLHDICCDIIIDTQGSGQQPMFVNSCRKRVIL